MYLMFDVNTLGFRKSMNLEIPISFEAREAPKTFFSLCWLWVELYFLGV
jgi:hypothetical protein